ncbi:nucleoside-diphosphate sugar epimerase/dehydratase [Peribacillus psychrosaccharolyticus]|uniref:polysaccharide biosynthesis protein n=1 Tax=Peribacillus psychrosaccharolyticus TaxID=1407 RepID=UPI003D2B899E
MTSQQRLFFVILVDSCIVLSAIFAGRFLVDATIYVVTIPLIVSSLTILISHHVFSIQFKLYKKAWEYASISELLLIFKTVTASILVTSIVQLTVLQDVYFRLLAVTWLLHMLFIGGSRFCWRIYRDRYLAKEQNRKRTLIIGAGSAGTMIARQLLKKNESDLLPVAFIDDNRRKHGLDIYGIPVIGGVSKIVETIQNYSIERIIIAIPSLNKQQINTIYTECAKTDVKTQTLPMIEHLLTGQLSVNKLRDIQVEDLLGRKTVELDIEGISEYVTNKVILVTGAGGSIGSEICRQICKFTPQKVILLGHGENSIYSIEMELREKYKQTNIEFLPEIADVQDFKKMMMVMESYKPDVVYHAAAHKHVPLMENNPEEAVKNNLIGTTNVAQAASWNGVGIFVMISSDKAVNPTSVMGATKRLAEMAIQDMDQKSDTRLVAVRFGNVLGSRGSVIPLFTKQIERGGPVTVTHPDMVRYFMTIPEASRLVIQAGALASGGEIFVLDMGEPVKIVDLAKNVIRLSGNSVEEIGISFSGIRPGEKLFEELLNKDEVHETHIYPNIYIGKTGELYQLEIEEIIKNYGEWDKETLRNKLINLANHRVVPQPLLSIN